MGVYISIIAFIFLTIFSCLGYWGEFKSTGKLSCKTWCILIFLVLTLIFGIADTIIKDLGSQEDKKDIISTTTATSDTTRKKLESGILHTDSSIDKSKQEIQDFINEKEKKRSSEVSESSNLKKKARDRKPIVDLFPLKADKNPRIDKGGINDLSKFYVFLTNNGDTYAKNVAVDYSVLSGNNNISKDDSLNRRSELNHTEIIPPGEIRSTYLIFQTRHSGPNSILYFSVAICFRDSLNRKYGPIHHIYRTNLNDSIWQVDLPDEEDFNRMEARFKQHGLWREKYF
ncbi:hypothetical protein ACX0G9_19210 [Flavitalea flava]